MNFDLYYAYIKQKNEVLSKPLISTGLIKFNLTIYCLEMII